MMSLGRRKEPWQERLDIALVMGDDDAVQRELALREALLDIQEQSDYCYLHQDMYHTEDGCGACQRGEPPVPIVDD